MRALAVFAVLAALTMTGCNDDVLHPTIPPITGIVGGPTAGNGTGSVAVEVRADELSAVIGTQIQVQNLSRVTEAATAEANGSTFQTLIIGGDVGDTLRVTLTHPDEGVVNRDFEVPRPTINDVRDTNETASVIYPGGVAQVTGEGFCHAAEANTIILELPDGSTQLLGVQVEPRPGLVFFEVPVELDPGTYKVRVATAGTEGQSPTYVSDPFTVELLAP